MRKVRADLLLVRQRLAPSRTKAQALIMAGEVLLEDGRRVEKAGLELHEGARLRLRKGTRTLRYASRGGLKLEGALETFGLDPGGAVCLDVGASTGGFTDCLLQHGAARVYALDVGYGQLAWKLQQDPRVVVRDRCNIRTAADDTIPEACDWLVIDVSFISLRIALPSTLRFLQPKVRLVALVKPQFELGPGSVGKGGVVHDDQVRHAALTNVVEEVSGLGFGMIETASSPIAGAAGNQEFLLTGVGNF